MASICLALARILYRAATLLAVRAARSGDKATRTEARRYVKTMREV